MHVRTLGALAVIISVPVLFAWGCGGPTKFGEDGGVDADVDAVDDVTNPIFPEGAIADAPGCVNLQCDINLCGGNTAATTLSGTVYAPNGVLPLYNVIVYVPNAPVDPFTPGVTCDQCGAAASGSPIAVALTDSKGHFSVQGVPSGSKIPVVIQVGKWRRQIVVDTVNPCVDNPIGQQVSGVEQLTRLPKNQQEGDMPKIAITTGGCDQLGCIMPKIGIDPKEYAAGPTSSAVKPKTAISFYSGGGAGAPTGSPPAQPFWTDVNQLKNFDLAILSCECHEPNDANQSSYDAIQKYLEAGGRIFTTDFMYVWYKFSKDTDLNATPWAWPGGAPGGVSPFLIDTSFPKGKSLADWLYYVSSIVPYKAQTTQPPVNGQFPVQVAYDNIKGINTKYGLEWAHSGGDPKFVTMNMPSKNPPAQQCGKAVHLDAHISVGDSVDTNYPADCNANAKETELATVFFLFDLSSCIQDDTVAPIVPK